MRPRFPLYIPSKGRADSRLTSRALTAQGVDHYIVVEPAEVETYERAVAGTRATVLPLDMTYKERYELCDDLGLSKGTGPGPARNFIWEHSIAAGYDWHWVMDDNIGRFDWLRRNAKVEVRDPVYWRMMEDFVLRYSNVGMAGPNYAMFVPARDAVPPFVTNTRIYSCNLIRNDLPFRWRGRYNEDTILSLDLLKAGWATIQFNAFLQWKAPTQTIGGGNTAEFYAREGTRPKSAMLKRVHPDCTRLIERFGRDHHFVDYLRFRSLLLKPREDAPAIPDYGLRLVVRKDTPSP